MTAKDLGFWIVALFSVGSAVMVVLHRNPVRSALFLIVNFLCLAFFYVMLNAQLLAALQVLVYAGAIMVLFLFVVMLLNLGGEQSIGDPLPGQKGAAVVLGIVLLVGLVAAVRAAKVQEETSGPPPAAATVDPMAAQVLPAKDQGDQVRVIGALLMTRYVYPFELTSVLLLVGIAGTVLLAKRKLPEEGERGGRS